MDSRAYWVWLQHGLGPGSAKIRRILEEYVSIAQFYEAGTWDWRLLGILTKKELDDLHAFSLEDAADLIASHEAAGIQVLTPESDGYPEKLRQIYDLPAVLYVKGVLPPFDDLLSIAVVGTRKATSSGLVAARSISRALAQKRVIVVSGGALGIDTAAHTGALEADGITVCVLGCGIGYPYLPGNETMRRSMMQRGALISEYPLGTAPLKNHFPLRNRIISGLCDGTLVVEAGTTSGSLITARDAREQDRDVFAVPGSVTKTTSEGANNLIKSGAKLTTDSWDILEEYETRYPYLCQNRFGRKGPVSPSPQKEVERKAQIEPAPETERETPAKTMLTPERFAQMCREKTWDISLKDFPSEAEVAMVKQQEKTCKTPELSKSIPAVQMAATDVQANPSFPEEKREPDKAQAGPTLEKMVLPPGMVSPEAARLWQSLSETPQDLPDLCAKTGLSAQKLLAAVTELELSDLIETMSGNRYRRIGPSNF